jgi:hypothetical protein
MRLPTPFTDPFYVEMWNLTLFTDPIYATGGIRRVTVEFSDDARAAALFDFPIEKILSVHRAAIRTSDRLFEAIAKMGGLSGVAVCVCFLRHSAENFLLKCET